MLKKHRTHGRVKAWLVLAAVAVVAAAIAALGATTGRASAAAHMTAGASSASLFTGVGDPLVGANGAVHFGCQLTNPGGCYGPDQIRAAYGIQPLLNQGYDGTGSTIVIIDAYGSPTLSSDLATFDGLWGLPAANLSIVAPFGIAPTTPANASGWSGETSLDVEWAHAVAPGAKILLVVAKSNDDSDILDATQWVRDNNAGDVVSQSYGEAEQCMGDALLARQHALFADLTREGITLFASSGDQGAAQPTCDGAAYFKAVSTPASDPLVTGVGGTTLLADGPSGTYESESTWNESALLGDAVAGGGGVSVVYSRPSYQASVQKTAMRTVPDVSYNAAIFHGVLTRWNNGWWRFGGTSAGSPQWAGLTAIADQIAGGRVGPIDKALYDAGKNQKQSTYFHDIADGSTNSIPDLTPSLGASFGTPIQGFAAVPGYDFATGLGTPVANTLVPYLAKNAGNGNDNYGSVASTIGGAKGHHKNTH